MSKQSEPQPTLVKKRPTGSPRTISRRQFMQMALAASPALLWQTSVHSKSTVLPPAQAQFTFDDNALQETTRFAVIGDFGLKSSEAYSVAKLVDKMNPDFVATVGDNNYPTGSAKTIDTNIGRFYHHYIYPYKGKHGPGADENRFFPVLGNHDWKSLWTKDDNNFGPYFDYFSLPGNERYYTFQRGPVRCFMLDSDYREPDGISGVSTQAMWLRDQLAASDAAWNLVFLHHAPYSSGSGHGSHPFAQWPFAEWGAHAVLAGHDHVYERLTRDGILYFVNGLGGKSRRGFRRNPIEGSQARFTGRDGAMLVTADNAQITFQFLHTGGDVVDSHTLTASTRVAATPLPAEHKRIDLRIRNPTDDVVAHGASVPAAEQNPLALRLGSKLSGDAHTDFHIAALRFPAVEIPPCTQIISASIEFTACHLDDEDTSLLIYGEKSGNAQGFDEPTLPVPQRPETGNTIQWENIEAWQKVGQAVATPDLSTIVQEIVHQPDWKSGNALALFFRGWGQRHAATCDLQPAAAPRLQIVYRVPEPEDQLIGTDDFAPDAPSIEHQTNRVFLPLVPASGCRQ